MINDGINDVPDKTLVVFSDSFETEFNKKNIRNVIDHPPKKRDWFRTDFYHCLPLTIGNQYGFIFKAPHDVFFEWNGGEFPDDLKIGYNIPQEEAEKSGIKFLSWFGRGIVTVDIAFTMRTPPGINLMTISPPNYIMPNMTVMTGVVETDNIRRNFTFNIKISEPRGVKIPKGYPFVAVLPIPRYFGDGFKLKMAEEVFDKDIVLEELQASTDQYLQKWEVDVKNPGNIGKQYFKGYDVYGNKFKDHQKP